MLCPDCFVECEEEDGYEECPDCGTRFVADSDPEDPEVVEEEEDSYDW